MANHREAGQAHMRPLTCAGKGSHRREVASASAVKASMIGALATATIAIPLASAAANEGVLPDMSDAALPAPATEAPIEIETVALPVADVQDAAVEYGVSAPAEDLSAQPAEVDIVVNDGADSIDVAAGSWAHPTPGAPITSGFGFRIHPTLGYEKMHNGVDFGASCGTPVYVPGPGTVVGTGSHYSAGTYVNVQHADGSITEYFHLQDVYVTQGQSLDAGDRVGSVGNTGRSTGCHLHFGLKTAEGAYVDPMSLWR